MKKETQLELFKKFTEKQLEIISSKQEDYCDTEECVLGNFKTAGANAGISTEQQILSLIATKVARLGNLFKGKIPNNESIEDSIIDMANYCFLLYCTRNEAPEQGEVYDELNKEQSLQCKFLQYINEKSQKSDNQEQKTYKDNCY